MDFGERLREVREDRELTQAEAANRCGHHQGQWAHWESGRRTPNGNSLLRIGMGLHCGPGVIGWLVMGDDGEGG